MCLTHCPLLSRLDAQTRAPSPPPRTGTGVFASAEEIWIAVKVLWFNLGKPREEKWWGENGAIANVAGKFATLFDDWEDALCRVEAIFRELDALEYGTHSYYSYEEEDQSDEGEKEEEEGEG